jgi:hypothetical protein
MGWFRKAFLACALWSAAHGQVTLDFQSLSLLDYGIIPSNYGSNLTPNLASIAYRTFTVANNATLTNYLEFWNNGYGDLTKVAFASSNGYAAEVAINAQAGYAVRLISFDMAGWPTTDRTNTHLRLLDAAGATLLNYAAAGPVAIQGDANGPQHSTFAPNLVSAGSIRIQWGNDWNVGIDNIQFQVVPIPEPPAWILLALGGTAGAWWLRRRRRTDSSS